MSLTRNIGRRAQALPLSAALSRIPTLPRPMLKRAVRRAILEEINV